MYIQPADSKDRGIFCLSRSESISSLFLARSVRCSVRDARRMNEHYC